MTVTDSTFCFEFIVKELHSLILERNFGITNQFGEIFKFDMLHPNRADMLRTALPRRKRKKEKQEESKKRQTIEYEGNIDLLLNYMNRYPMELSLWKKSTPLIKEGVTVIPWHTQHINFVKRVAAGFKPTAVTVNNAYSVYSYINSKKMGTIRLAIKIALKKESSIITAQNFQKKDNYTDSIASYKSLQHLPPSVIYSNLLHFVHSLKPNINKIDKIRTIYRGKILSPHDESKKTILEDFTDFKQNNEISKTSLKHLKNLKTDNKNIGQQYIDVDQYLTPIKWLNYVKSDTELQNDKKIKIRMTRSSSLMQNKHSYNLLKYILPVDKPIHNQIFFVGYMTVQKDDRGNSRKLADCISPRECKSVSRQSSSVRKEDLPPFFKFRDCLGLCNRSQDKFRFRICDPKCPVPSVFNQKDVTCELDIPASASHLVEMTKCDQLLCDDRLHPVPLEARDDRILINMANPDNVCCEKSKFQGGVYKKLEADGHPCVCTCSCNFGFEKRTTFCEICRGIEEVGVDLDGWLENDKPHLCPIYHHLPLKKPKPPSPQEPKKKCPTPKMPKNIFGDRKDLKDGESATDTKDQKKEKKPTADMFKYNYGYAAPKSGHGHCLVPCGGRNNGVPRNMGWLWTSENIAGLKFSKGWRPGAISKALLRKLNKAKRVKAPLETENRNRRSRKKKSIEDKPTLIIKKVEGEFIVEMKAEPDKSAPCQVGPQESYKPVIYKITRPDHERRVQKRAKRKERLIKQKVNETWSDPYHPERCDDICGKAFRQAICPSGSLEALNEAQKKHDAYEEYLRNYSDGEESDSDCSSMDVDWEIHFTPPYDVWKSQ